METTNNIEETDDVTLRINLQILSEEEHHVKCLRSGCDCLFREVDPTRLRDGSLLQYVVAAFADGEELEFILHLRRESPRGDLQRLTMGTLTLLEACEVVGRAHDPRQWAKMVKLAKLYAAPVA